VTTCNVGEFKCNNNHCITKNWQCDGTNDCLDGSDEINCTYSTCSPNDYQCKNTHCVPMEYVCDGRNDCWDNSDEDGTACAALRAFQIAQSAQNSGRRPSRRR
jgi:hypothetical protein